MPHVIERAPSGRATCRGCGRKIAAGERRFGERLPNPYDEKGGEMTHWFHLACAAFKRPEPFLEALAAASDPIEERATLEHQARLGVSHRRVPRINTIERASSGRAACRSCRETIAKGDWRISLVYYEEGRFAPSGFIHVRCAQPYLETIDILARLKHFSPSLSDADLDDIRAELRRT
jgi:ribosomal protein L37AE/L43A